ncbi:MAG: hypothetical protein R3B40_24750 [Polyangiales bacterium]
MRRALCLVGCCGVALTLVLTRVAGAQPTGTGDPATPPAGHDAPDPARPRPSLVVQVTPRCPAASGAEARFAPVLAATERERGEVRVSIVPHPDGFALHFLASLPEGETARELTDPDCAALLSASVLLAAIALDVPIEQVEQAVLEAAGDLPPDAGAGDPETSPEVPSERDPASDPDVAGDPNEGPLAGDPAPPALRFYAFTALGLGTPLLPALRPDGALGLALFHPRPRASLGVVAAFRWTGPAASTAPVSGVRVDGRALGAELGVCAEKGRAAWALSGCGGGRVWRVRGQGRGSDMDRVDHAADVALWAGLGVTLQLHPRVGLRASVGGAVHLLRARLNIMGLGALHTAPQFQAEGSLAVWVRLGAMGPSAPESLVGDGG